MLCINPDSGLNPGRASDRHFGCYGEAVAGEHNRSASEDPHALRAVLLVMR